MIRERDTLAYFSCVQNYTPTIYKLLTSNHLYIFGDTILYVTLTNQKYSVFNLRDVSYDNFVLRVIVNNILAVM